MSEQTRASAEAASGDKARIGLVSATALVVGSIVGTGIFLLPRSLAPYGSIALVAFGLAAVGAIFLALMFGALSRRMPADGGPYAYARAAFGNAPGFFSAWSYWITAWAGNSAIVVAWVAYVEVFINTDGDRTISIVIALVGLAVPAVINLLGVQQMAVVQVITTILKFIPLVIISTVGLFFIDWSYLQPFNRTGGSALAAIVTTMALAVFSFLGVETASVAAGKVRNPTRNVPRASLLGTLAAAVVYILSTLVIFGTVPNGDLQDPDSQPFVQSFNAMFGGSWAGYAVAIAAIISGFGALNGWTMICAEMPLAAAREGLFPRRFADHVPARSSRVRHHLFDRSGLHPHGVRLHGPGGSRRVQRDDPAVRADGGGAIPVQRSGAHAMVGPGERTPPRRELEVGGSHRHHRHGLLRPDHLRLLH